MRNLLGGIVFLLICSAPAMAQTAPKWELGGGYTFRSFMDPQSNSRLPMNGWSGTADYTVIKRWLSAAIDIDGAYNNYGLYGNTSVYTAMIGPQIYPLGHHKLTLFAHALFGEGYTRDTLPASGGFNQITFSSNAFAMEGGAGLDYTLKKRWAIRLIQFDYEDTRFYPAIGIPQGNYKI
ncbi:MAG: outer membrane beta-barrel protein, partial [Candidatus Acidiferrales bacterium]